MNEKQAVMDLDRQFCKDCETGKERAWASYFAEDGFMITQGTRDNIVGKSAIEDAMKSTFALSDIVFFWEPNFCEISDDATLAVTKGTSMLQYTKDNETVTLNGNYTTIWKKVNGEWKISWDIGN